MLYTRMLVATCYQLLNALIFQPLLNKNVPEYDITTLFQKCGISARTLLVSPSCFTRSVVYTLSSDVLILCTCVL